MPRRAPRKSRRALLGLRISLTIMPLGIWDVRRGGGGGAKSSAGVASCRDEGGSGFKTVTRSCTNVEDQAEWFGAFVPWG